MNLWLIDLVLVNDSFTKMVSQLDTVGLNWQVEWEQKWCYKLTAMSLQMMIRIGGVFPISIYIWIYIYIYTYIHV